ncbi:hypothetical protein BKA82DRAFT_4178472 [Pisolithus tinctorius]|nr:hypothetical protein BKA82DRAFT_4178472 [Pisolithus tinctorius]
MTIIRTDRGPFSGPTEEHIDANSRPCVILRLANNIAHSLSAMRVSKCNHPTTPFATPHSTLGQYWHVAVLTKTWLPSIWYHLGLALIGPLPLLAFPMHIQSSELSISRIIKMPMRCTAILHLTTRTLHTMVSPAVAPSRANSQAMPSHSCPSQMISSS